jgi:putative peptide zinc metalloprotease protein
MKRAPEKPEYCAWPPQLAADVEITEQRDNGRVVFVAGSVSAGRFTLLGENEARVLELLRECLTPAAVCAEFGRRHGATLSPVTLARFLTKLDGLGLLAGAHKHELSPDDLTLEMAFYKRYRLFDPDRLFVWLLQWVRWIWTPSFVVISSLLMLVALASMLANAAALASYSLDMVREHYFAVLMASLLTGFAHEFAHGLTCRAFGGRVPEVGLLRIYYFIPALYCNVSGIRLIRQRSRRLWVIAAGTYCQLVFSALSLLSWLLFVPYSRPADLACICFLGSIVGVWTNANPLIKFDGYYLLSQWLHTPNLMDRSRAYWRGLLKRALFGLCNLESARWSRRERLIYFVYGLLSFSYTVSLRFIIVCFVGARLIEWLHLSGLFLTAGLACFYLRPVLRRLLRVMKPLASKWVQTPFVKRLENLMGKTDQNIAAIPEIEAQAATHRIESQVVASLRPWRRVLVPLAIFLLIIAALLVPWNASIGNDSTLVAVPGHEAIIRAPENATLIALRTQPGQQVASGALIGQMGNLELEEQIVQVESELARAQADYDRLLSERHAHREAVARAELQQRQRQYEYDQINFEQQQIAARRLAESVAGTEFMIASASPAALSIPASQPVMVTTRYPAAIAVLQAEVDLRRARLDEASSRRARARQLYGQGLLPRSELETAETLASALAIELSAARERLEAALIDHQRKHTTAFTEVNLARTDLGAAVLQIEKLSGELRAMSALLKTLRERHELLQRRRAQFALVTPRAGAIFGEELPRLVGQYFQKGAEICRIADTRQLLVRIQVPEHEIGAVRVGHAVRLKARAFPDQVFRGAVSKIGLESEPDQHHQTTYRVELTVENADGLLRPGMTAFARIDFDRQRVGQILFGKLKRVLRPELWLL